MDRFLPKILAILTRQSREKVAITWSDTSWTHNVFRLYELIFWRRQGIRPEQLSDHEGNIYSFTLENYLATFEGAVRSYLKKGLGFKVVLVPQMQLAGFQSQYGQSPYRFAIAFDAFTDGGAPGAGSLSFNHTITGSNVYLVVYPWGPISDVNGVTGVNWNTSEALTLLDKNGTNGTVRWLYSFIRMAPTIGTHSVDIICPTADQNGGAAVSYSGAGQTGQPDAHNNALGTATTSFNCAITVVAANCWITALGYNDQGAATFTGTNRGTLGANTARKINDSNATVSTGSNTYTESWTNNGAGVICMSSFTTFAAAAVVTPKLPLLGVG